MCIKKMLSAQDAQKAFFRLAKHVSMLWEKQYWIPRRQEDQQHKQEGVS